MYVFQPVLRLQSIQGRKQVSVSIVDFQFAAICADTFEDFLDGLHETRVEDWAGKFDMTEMTGTFGHAFTTSFTLRVSVNS